MSRPQDPPEVMARFHETLSLVDSQARQVRRLVGAEVEYDDLVGYGREGLLDAARRYDPERGVPFRAYASYRVRGAIIDGVRAMARLPRRAFERLRAVEAALRTSEGSIEDLYAPQPPGTTSAEAEQLLTEHVARMATAMALGLVAPHAHGEEGETVGATTGEDPEQLTAEAELLSIVRHAITELPEQEAELVRRHYLEGERFDRVAQDLGLSKSWASRLHTRAIGRLSKRLSSFSGG